MQIEVWKITEREYFNLHILLPSLAVRCTIMLWITKHCQLTQARMQPGCNSDLDFRNIQIQNNVQFSSSVVTLKLTAISQAFQNAKAPKKLSQTQFPPIPWMDSAFFPEMNIRGFSSDYKGQVSHQNTHRASPLTTNIWGSCNLGMSI